MFHRTLTNSSSLKITAASWTCPCVLSPLSTLCHACKPIKMYFGWNHISPWFGNHCTLFRSPFHFTWKHFVLYLEKRIALHFAAHLQLARKITVSQDSPWSETQCSRRCARQRSVLYTWERSTIFLRILKSAAHRRAQYILSNRTEYVEYAAQHSPRWRSTKDSVV
jgi:hypothetical protein